MEKGGFNLPSRRSFLARALFLGVFFALSARVNVTSASMSEWFYKIRGRIRPRPTLLSDSERESVALPGGGENVPVETALNSRCSSDYDDDTHYFHHGMFEKHKKLFPEEIQRIVAAAAIPRVATELAGRSLSGKEISFFVRPAADRLAGEWLMVVSGMQQQAVCLACAAMGAGMKFQNMGKNGKQLDDGRTVVIRMKIDALKPSYDGSFWTSQSPGGHWASGNLPEPDRTGTRPLLKALDELGMARSGNTAVSEEVIGQLLWAARGRTPHLFFSKHGGMTIPSWEGEQNYTALYFLRKGNLFEYANEYKGKPTHAMKPLQSLSASKYREVETAFGTPNGLLVFARRESSAHTFWQVGYMLLNALVQAGAIDLTYQGLLLDETQKAFFESAGIVSPTAALALR